MIKYSLHVIEPPSPPTKSLDSIPVADPWGVPLANTPHGPKFSEFHAVFGKIRQMCILASPLGVGAPSYGESCIRPWILSKYGYKRTPSLREFAVAMVTYLVTWWPSFLLLWLRPCCLLPWIAWWTRTCGCLSSQQCTRGTPLKLNERSNLSSLCALKTNYYADK